MAGYMSRENIIIEGTQGGVKFTIPVVVNYDPTVQTIEQAIIEQFRSTVSTFEELAVQEQWSGAYWTYPNNTLMGAV